MKKFNEKMNVIGDTLRQARENKNLTKVEFCRRLELLGVYFTRDEIYKIENDRASVKDFELIAFCKVLEIDFATIEKLIEIQDEDEKDRF